MNATPETVKAAVDRYIAEQFEYEAVAARVVEGINSILDHKHILARVEGRAKDVRSLHKKAFARHYEDPWRETTDKAGVRAVFYEPRHVDEALGAIVAAYGEAILEVEDKRQVLDPKRLDYSGIHVHIAESGDLASKEIRRCEVQLRTASQDAWSVVSHRVIYKPVGELSDSMQHAVYRLVALVELFDQEVERITSDPVIRAGEQLNPIMDAVEGHYLELANSPSDRRVSFIIPQALLPCLSEDELAHYPDLLSLFVAAEETYLRTFFKEYGPHSEVSSLPDYLLTTQAESLFILERLWSKKHKLNAVWNESGLPRPYLDAFAAAAGVSLPDG